MRQRKGIGGRLRDKHGDPIRKRRTLAASTNDRGIDLMHNLASPGGRPPPPPPPHSADPPGGRSRKIIPSDGDGKPITFTELNGLLAQLQEQMAARTIKQRLQDWWYNLRYPKIKLTPAICLVLQRGLAEVNEQEAEQVTHALLEQGYQPSSAGFTRRPTSGTKEDTYR